MGKLSIVAITASVALVGCATTLTSQHGLLIEVRTGANPSQVMTRVLGTATTVQAACTTGGTEFRGSPNAPQAPFIAPVPNAAENTDLARAKADPDVLYAYIMPWPPAPCKNDLP